MGKKLLAKCNCALDALLSFTAVINSVMVAFLIISVCYEVVCRYFFDRPHSWVAEVGGFIMLGLPFLATGWVLKNDTHIRMDLLYEKLSSHNRAIFDAVTSLMSIIVCGILIWRGTGIVVEVFENNTRTNTTLLVVQWPFMALIPFGILLFLLEYLRKFLRSISQLSSNTKT